MNSIEIRHVDKFPEPDFSRLQRLVFADVQRASPELAAVLHQETANMPPPGQEQQAHSPMCRIGAYDSDELVGWTCGWMERANVFYMANSGVVAPHRRQGIYKSLVNAVRAHAVAAGAIAIRSQHSVLNNPVLIAKLRDGFSICGLSQSAEMGTLVELVMHLSEKRQEIFRARALPCVVPDASREADRFTAC